jgi:hypothetical protein
VEAYDRSQYFEQRRALMRAWADYLDELRADTAVVAQHNVRDGGIRCF